MGSFLGVVGQVSDSVTASGEGTQREEGVWAPCDQQAWQGKDAPLVPSMAAPVTLLGS